MAVERLLFMDLLMNLGILGAVQAALGHPHLPSLLRALILAGTNTLIGCLISPPGWRSVPVQGAVCLLLCALVLRERSPARILRAAPVLLCTTASAAGLAPLGARGMLLPLAGAVGCGLLLRRRRHPHCRWNVEITAEKNGVRERFPALIDTGNRLCEHRSGLPVLIVESGAVPRLDTLMKALPRDEVRTLGFGVLGSSGELSCFRPDRLSIHAGYSNIPAPDCWIAVFHDRIPGRTCALAPPEFADYSHASTVPEGAISDRIRRMSYALFNR